MRTQEKTQSRLCAVAAPNLLLACSQLSDQARRRGHQFVNEVGQKGKGLSRLLVKCAESFLNLSITAL